MQPETIQKKNLSLSQAARVLSVSRSAITNAATNGNLVPVFGGLFHDRLVGVTAASVNAVLHRRHEIEAARAANGKGCGSVRL